LANIGDLRDFQRLMHLLAARVATVLNMAELARDVGVDVKTVKRWISILEASYVVFLLPPFYENFGKRIVKSPKICFYDTGLVSFLTGIQTEEQYRLGPLAGPLFENYVIAEIMKKNLHLKTHASLYFLRINQTDEIDVIVDYGSERDLIEIKSGKTFKSAMVSTLQKYQREQDRSYLLYQGPPVPHAHVQVMPFSDYLLS
jgi:predicted AAA+ superfamily ATPase